MMVDPKIIDIIGVELVYGNGHSMKYYFELSKEIPFRFTKDLRDIRFIYDRGVLKE